MATTAPARIAAAQAPYDSIQQWSKDVLAPSMVFSGDGTELPPSQAALEEVLRALGAVQEFCINPIGERLQSLVDAEAERREPGRVPEGARLFDYEDVGRYILWADKMREELGYALAEVTKVALLAHEDIASIAGGWIPDGQATKPGRLNEHLRRIHGLDVVA